MLCKKKRHKCIFTLLRLMLLYIDIDINLTLHICIVSQKPDCFEEVILYELINIIDYHVEGHGSFYSWCLMH